MNWKTAPTPLIKFEKSLPKDPGSFGRKRQHSSVICIFTEWALVSWNQYVHYLLSPIFCLGCRRLSNKVETPQKKNSFNENRDWPECQVQPMRLHSLLLNQAWAVKESHNVEKSFLFQRSVEGDSSMPLPGTRNTVDSYSSGHPGGR